MASFQIPSKANVTGRFLEVIWFASESKRAAASTITLHRLWKITIKGMSFWTRHF